MIEIRYLLHRGSGPSLYRADETAAICKNVSEVKIIFNNYGQEEISTVSVTSHLPLNIVQDGPALRPSSSEDYKILKLNIDCNSARLDIFTKQYFNILFVDQQKWSINFTLVNQSERSY